ncbi:membrane protein YczE [Cellulomonas fengjieae]|uniref:membrane protein YczE n=1 Tax=Cellulomonas fengjieae TaxID=2819978 RepID=UPI001FB8F21D|nr:hypothetical protein [Cellulomonas fengjieae]
MSPAPETTYAHAVRTSTRPGRPGVRAAVQLLAGLVLYAASIAMLVDAGLGSMPWDVLTQGVVRRTDLSFGVVTLLVSLVVLACWIPLRQRPGIGTVANVVVISALVDPFLALLAALPDAMGVRITLVVAGIVLNGLATGLYVGARLGPGPRDGLMTGLVHRTGRSVRLVRTTIEVTVVSVGWLLGGTVGLATLAYALAIGPLVHLFLTWLTVPAEVVEPVAV